jgi:signal transduction histidine kinase
MSVKTSLLLLFGLLVGMLSCAALGFYWAVEQSIAEQDLLQATRRQLVELHTFSTAVYRQAKEVADVLVLGKHEVEQLNQARASAAAPLARMIRENATELRSADNAGDEIAATAERIEREDCVKLQATFDRLCEITDLAVASSATGNRTEWTSLLQRLETVFDQHLVPLFNQLMTEELKQVERRGQRSHKMAHLLESIAVAVCLATMAITVAGTMLLWRSLRVVVHREGAEAANRAKSEFLANMSHELRTPMTAILGFADILAQDLTDPEKRDAATTIKRNGEHLLEIINGILDLSKIEAGKLETDRVPCSPWQITADVCSLMRIRAAAKGLQLIVEHRGPLPQTILTSPFRLRQILINLLGNAIKFTEVGSVRLVTELIHTTAGDAQLRFDVIDTGIGMSPAEMEGLFQPFAQVNSSTTRHSPGTGLGLAISKRLAELLGGSITVTSVPGQGSTFSVTIQIGSLEGVEMLDHLDEVLPKRSAAKRESAQTATRLHGRILLAEDGPDNQRLICFLLRRSDARR